MKEQKVEERERLVNKISERSAKTEFEERLKAEQVVLLAVGSTSYGFDVPGLLEEELKLYVESGKYPVEIEFTDDPAPAFATDDYWDAVDRFLNQYNKLALAHLKQNNG